MSRVSLSKKYLSHRFLNVLMGEVFKKTLCCDDIILPKHYVFGKCKKSIDKNFYNKLNLKKWFY